MQNHMRCDIMSYPLHNCSKVLESEWWYVAKVSMVLLPDQPCVNELVVINQVMSKEGVDGHDMQ